MNTSNPVFIGRRWLFEQLEDLFQKNDSLNGVLLVGDPGSGKTTIMKQLVNSRINSSRFIHENIIAYHFCEYDRETTRVGGEFVKSLVEQLSRNVPGFKKSIQSQEIQKILRECKNQPVECSRVAILDPLHNLKISSETKKFILIDALDECREKKGSYNEIIKILHGQKIRLPSWVKLLVSSRNETTITGKISEIGSVETIAIKPTSKNNLNDIRSFAQEMISRYEFRKENGESMKQKLSESIESVLKKTEGNFLSIQMLLDNWAENPDKISLTSIPSDMKHVHVYALSFRERFEEKELERFATFFEVLLASNSPPTLQLLNEIFWLKDPKYECDKVVYKLSAYLRFNNGNIRIFHHSFAEWLINQDTPIDGFSIAKSRGHQYITDYLFEYYNQEENELTVERLYELSMHVLNGGMLKEHVRKLKGLNSNIIDQSGECILHYLARNSESTHVLKVFIQQFKSVDVFNREGHTPAYYATIADNYHNLELLIKKGADVNYVAKVPNYCTINSLFYHDIIYEYHTGSYCFSLIFIAADKGYRKIVQFLMKNGAHFDKEDKCGWKPLFAAVKAGDLKIVELLMNKTNRTSSDDLVSLHLAVVFDHSDILTFLLKSGARDKCIPCKRDYNDDGSMFQFGLTTHQYLKKICGSVLNIAVARRYLKIVEILLSYGNETLECKSLAGLTPLMRAVERNDTKMVTLLLDEGADVEAQCETSNEHKYLRKIFHSTYHCSCAGRAIHISLIQGTSKITAELIEWNADGFSRDCIGWSADDLAAITNEYINPSVLNNKTMMRYLAVCGSVKTFELLSRNKSSDVLTTIYEDGMTLLHLATLGLNNVFSSVCSIFNCTAFKCPRMNAHRKEPYLKTMKLLTKVTPQHINKKDKYGRTALHYAALVRSPDIVKYLIQKGSDWKIKDENGDTALKFMLKQPLDYINLGPCSTVIYSLLNSSEMVISNDMHVNCLRMLQVRTSAERCPDSTIIRILKVVHLYNLPLSWYTLFKIDADLCCLSHKNPSVFQYTAISTISELLKVVELDVKVNCELPVQYSFFHIMAFMLHLSRFAKNYFSTLQRHVDSYSMEYRILGEYYADDFLPIHLAVLGNKIDTVDLFMNQGVDIWKKTRSGWTVFDLSLMNQQCLPQMLDKLLNHITSNKEYKVPSSSDFWCNTTSGVSLLHIAAVRGFRCLSYIQNNTFIPLSSLPFTSCNNKHGIDLLYLLKLYHDVEWTTDWTELTDLGLPTNTTLSKYPEREAEYHLSYNRFFLTPDVNLNLKFEVDVLDLFRHPEINNFLPHRYVIAGQIKRCYDRCWHSASHASRSFLSTFYTVFIINNMFDPRSDGFVDIVPQMAELRYHCVKMFYKVSTALWRQVSKAYTCSHKCRCLEIMRLLQKTFTSKTHWSFRSAGRFVAERMGWHNTYLYDDIGHWPFGFLVKKALRMDKDYDYLKILIPREWKVV